MSDPLRVTVWGENVHEREEDAVRALYPDGHARRDRGRASRRRWAPACACAPRRSSSPSMG